MFSKSLVTLVLWRRARIAIQVEVQGLVYAFGSVSVGRENFPDVCRSSRHTTQVCGTSGLGALLYKVAFRFASRPD